MTSVGENWIATYKRMKLDPYLPPCTKVNSEWIKVWNVRPEAITSLIGGKLLDISEGNDFWGVGADLKPKAKAT